MAWIAQMNLILHGGHFNSVKYLADGGSLGHNSSAIKILPDDSIDLVVTNPPFGSDYDNINDLSHFNLGIGKKSRRRGVLFLEKCLRILKPNGRLAIILEESILNSGSNEDVRSFLANNAVVEAVISLPNSAFMPYATVKTSILILRKKSRAKESQSKILMCNLENVGHAPNGEPLYSNDRSHDGRLMLLSDFPNAFDAWQEFKELGKIVQDDENYFVVSPADNELTQRLDTLFYHPAKQNAQHLISQSIYPLIKIGQAVSIINNSVVPRFEYPEEIVRYIGLANIQPLEGIYYVSEILGEKIKSAVKQFGPETVIFSKLRPELRKVIYIPSNEEGGFVSSECFVFKTKEIILPRYLELMLRSDLVYGQIIFQVTGLGRPRINKADLLNVKIPLPPLEKQREFIGIMDNYQSNKSSLLEKSRMLQQQANKLVRQGFEDIERSLCRWQATT
jgi:hypothetical protein